jgi:phage gpG-like protein
LSTVPLTGLGAELQRRIAARMRRVEPNSAELRETMLRIGFILEAQTKLNIRRQGIIDTGRLFNSIRSEFYQRDSRVGIRVGSFGVPYAALHEFGGPFTDRQRRAMFQSLKDRGKLVRGRRGQDKNVVQGGRFLARPYLMPAVRTHTPRILELIRELFR